MNSFGYPTVIPYIIIFVDYVYTRGVGRWSSRGGHNLMFVDLESQTKLN